MIGENTRKTKERGGRCVCVWWGAVKGTYELVLDFSVEEAWNLQKG